MNLPQIPSSAVPRDEPDAIPTSPNRWWRWLGIELNVVSTTEKTVSVVGGFLAMLLLVVVTGKVLDLPGATAVVASMGASAVLLFALPHGQLSQPWPVIGGQCLSALVGVACARWIGRPDLAAAGAVALSIGIMHQLKCIHPPGGATALTAVLGGKAIQDMGFHFVLLPVLLNSVMMVALAVVINLGFNWRRYPAACCKPSRTTKPTDGTHVPSHEEVVAALRSLDVFVDVSEQDLIEIWRILSEQRALTSVRKSLPESGRAK
ncbi:MAG: HPP family protein [Verrucomicrobiota bacterium]